MHTHMHARVHACTLAHTHTHTYTHSHTHTHRDKHTHARTHTHTHTEKRDKCTCHSHQNHTINTLIPPFKQENTPFKLLELVLQEEEECQKARLGVCISIRNPFEHEKHQVSRYNFFFFFFSFFLFLSAGGGLLSYKHFSLSLEHHQDKFLCTS